MNDMMTPAWIKELKTKLEGQQRSQRGKAMAESLIRAEAPRLWEEFVRELEIQVKSCGSLPGFGACALHDISQTNPPEKVYRASLNGSGPYPNSAFTDVHFRIPEFDLPYIDCLRDALDHGKDFMIPIRVYGMGEVKLILPDGSAVNPKSAAEYVVKSMVRDMGLL